MFVSYDLGLSQPNGIFHMQLLQEILVGQYHQKIAVDGDRQDVQARDFQVVGSFRIMRSGT
ncbi:hypothetical protein SAMN00120144_4366 [Hymenobacter roseosalivarius DSM 11622]|uniref:Uncharacterized protein n=1 Tax=Hymenobacter roseosalivarius DSM 11622 TaxID=645990 RepID=A0A1W1UDA9_9BACT|nr:hypothetical protein SAMN00120144_4366 [Hymenobacter roseosalivarius DSM 11622]